MGKKRMAFKPVEPQPESDEENKEESSEESLQATPPPSPPRASESEKPKQTKEGQHSIHEGRKTRLTAAKRPSEDRDGNDVKKMKIGMEEGHHSSDGGRKTRLTSAKRPSEGTDGNDVKKVETEKKSNNFPRVWSEEDEIVVLNGFLDYSKEMGSDPGENWSAFYEFMRGKVHLDFTKVQLQDKVRRLKKKFKDNMRKKGKDKKGKERAFSTPHEQSLYDLSTQIWANATSKPDGSASEFEEIEDGGNAVGEKPNRKVNASVVEEIKDVPNAVEKKPNRKATASVFGEVEDVGDGGKWKELNPSAGIEETMLRNGNEIFESVHGNEDKTEWRKLRVEEMELYLKQLEVRVMQTKLILSVMKREDHRGGDEHV